MIVVVGYFLWNLLGYLKKCVLLVVSFWFSTVYLLLWMTLAMYVSFSTFISLCLLYLILVDELLMIWSSIVPTFFMTFTICIFLISNSWLHLSISSSLVIASRCCYACLGAAKKFI